MFIDKRRRKPRTFSSQESPWGWWKTVSVTWSAKCCWEIKQGRREGTGFYNMGITGDLKEMSKQGLVKKSQVERRGVKKWEQSGHLFQGTWLEREKQLSGVIENRTAREMLVWFVSREDEDESLRGYLVSRGPEELSRTQHQDGWKDRYQW